MNKQEIAKKELDGVVKERDIMATEVNSSKGEAQKVEQLYKEQDELLGKTCRYLACFDRNYEGVISILPFATASLPVCI